MRRPRAVIFDMDGLLIDSEPLWDEAIQRFCQARGVCYGGVETNACRGRGLPETMRYLAQVYGWLGSIEGPVQEILAYVMARIGDVECRPGAEALMQGLAGRLPLALASSSERPLIDAALQGRSWWGLFTTVVSGEEVSRRKPAPDIFLEAARRLGCPAAECWVFEDSLAGCEAAKAAGALVVAVPACESEAFRTVADVILPTLEGALKLVVALPLA